MDEIMEAMIELSNRHRNESTETLQEIQKAVEEAEKTMQAKKICESYELPKARYIRTKEGIEIYHMGRTKFTAMARDAGALYKIGGTVIVDVDIFEEYLKSFRVPGRYTA